MRRWVAPVLFILLLAEIAAAVSIVLAQPGGFGSLASFDWGPERSQAIPARVLELNGQPASINLKNSSGNIQVSTNPGLTGVQVSATKIVHSNDASAFDRVRFDVTQSGGSIQIEGGSNQPSIGLSNARVDIQVVLPPALLTSFTATTGSGDVDVRGLQNGKALLNINTGSGDISGDTLQFSQAVLHTGSGNIRTSNYNGGINAETGSGNIDMQGSNELNQVRFKTSSGNITVNAQLNDPAGGSFDTGSGNIRLHMANATAPGFNINVGSGDIRVNLPGVVFNRQDKHNVQTNGSPVVQMHTGSGNVEIN
ncbi:MAG TPA: DUF4097 family beta strand repeat-containing protein [Chloroflexia bacterium]|nr:DUF4097 family beta strand repeat-containing protein [Chloroflexia bacterium]